MGMDQQLLLTGVAAVVLPPQSWSLPFFDSFCTVYAPIAEPRLIVVVPVGTQPC